MKDDLLESPVLEAAMTYFGTGSPFRGPLLAAATLVVLVYIQKRLRKRLEAYLGKHAHKPENAAHFLRAYNAVCKTLIAILVVIAATGSFRLLGLTVAFFGTMLGWSLQVPIRGLAAWVMVLVTRPFRVGDRVTIAGVTGDVLDVQLNHILLNQVGGTVQGEERSGRGILVPNAMLFGESILNYNYFAQQDLSVSSPASKWMLDEVLVRLTFGSDYEHAKELCVATAKKAVDELVGETDAEPFARVEFLAWGILLRVRYKTLPAKRQEISSRVTRYIWQSINAEGEKVAFGFPVSITGLEQSPGEPAPPTSTTAV